MRKDERIVVMDLDGTLFDDFFYVDRRIIEEIFNYNKVILFIDNIARLVNSLGITKNTTGLLRLRLFFYSLFSKKSYKEVLSKYRKEYVMYAHKFIERNLWHYAVELGCNIIILSNNRYSMPLKAIYNNIIITKSKMAALKGLFDKYGSNLRCVIGDNFFDDILPARILKIKNIYITSRNISTKKRSRAKKKNNYYINNLEAILDMDYEI